MTKVRSNKPIRNVRTFAHLIKEIKMATAKTGVRFAAAIILSVTLATGLTACGGGGGGDTPIVAQPTEKAQGGVVDTTMQEYLAKLAKILTPVGTFVPYSAVKQVSKDEALEMGSQLWRNAVAADKVVATDATGKKNGRKVVWVTTLKEDNAFCVAPIYADTGLSAADNSLGGQVSCIVGIRYAGIYGAEGVVLVKENGEENEQYIDVNGKFASRKIK